MPVSSTLLVVAFGTSLTAAGGWQGTLSSALTACMNTEVDIKTVAKVGASSTWALRVVDQVVNLDPDIVLIEFSINDAALSRYMSVNHSKANTASIIRTIQRQSPRTKIFLMTMSPILGLHRLHRPFLDEYYDVYLHLAAEMGVSVIDNRKGWSKLSNSELRQAIPDGRHPDPRSAKLVAVPIMSEAVAGRPCYGTSDP